MGKGKEFVNLNRFKSGKLTKQGRKQESLLPSPQNITRISKGKAERRKHPQ